MSNTSLTQKWMQLLSHVKREKMVSTVNIIVMTVTFLILGLFLSLIVFTQTALRYLEDQAKLTIFFKDDFSEQNILTFQQNIENDNRISSTKYISKQEALRIFMEIHKDEPVLLESISADILPASLEVNTNKISELKNVAEQYSKEAGVEEIKLYRDVIDKFSKSSTIVYILGGLVLLISLGISFSVILITIKLTIQSKGTELEIMKLVGASDYYVKNPLISQGVFFGLLSAIIASVILFLLFIVLNVTRVFSLSSQFVLFSNLKLGFLIFPTFLSIVLILAGFGLGYIGSTTAVKKYLRY